MKHLHRPAGKRGDSAGGGGRKRGEKGEYSVWGMLGIFSMGNVRHIQYGDLAVKD